MSAITPCLWFDHSAEEAAAFYLEAFPRGAIRNTTHYPTEGLADFQKDFAGEVLTVDFEIAGQRFLALNAGDLFTFTPAISFMVNFDPSVDPDALQNLEALWEKLIDGGRTYIPLDEHPFSSRYGWLSDKFGVSWQLILTDPAGESPPMIIPSLLFGGAAQNRAHEATEYYLSVFNDSQMGADIRYAEQTGPATRAAVNFSDFRLRDQLFVAMDAGSEQDSTFTEAVSFVVPCSDQDEIDRYWAALSAVPEAEACGWCKDQFGVSWQITPENIDELMKRPNAFDHMMEMKKIEMAKL